MDTTGMMWWKRKEHRKGSEGFTLLELLMVVIIIGILASIALPTYLRTAERARAGEALTMLGAIRASDVRFRTQDQGQAYTTDFTLLDVDVPNNGQGVFQTGLWTFTLTGAGATATATATRRITGGARIDINLDTGQTCTSDVAQYGLTVCP